MSENSKRSHYGAIDGLRALSAIGIIMMHVKSNIGYKFGGAVSETVFGFLSEFVYLFMIISAFGVCCGYYEKISEKRFEPAEFYEKRIAKILPFFAFLTLVDLAVNFRVEAIMEAFANVTLVFGLLPNAYMSVIGVGWFIGTIFVFYMLFPFFCFLIKNKKSAWISLVIAMAYNFVCSIYFFTEKHSGTGGRYNILFCSMYFIAGGLIYLYKEQIEVLVKKYRAIVLIVIAAVVIGYFMLAESSPDIVQYLLLLIIFSGLLMYAIGAKSALLSNKVMKFLSSISLEMYLSHMLIFRVAEKMNLCTLFGEGWISYIAMAVIVTVGSIIFSVCFKAAWQAFCELIRLIKRDRSAIDRADKSKDAQI